MIRLWWEQAEGHMLKTRLICRNITVTVLSASTLTFSTAPGAEQAGAFGKGVDSCPKAREHGGKLLVGNTGEKRRRMEYREKFFHKKSSFVENSTDLLI